MGDMWRAVMRLVAHHRRKLALRDFPFLVGLADQSFFRHLLIGPEKISCFEKRLLFSVPRLAREVASFAQDVRWLVDMARDACRAPPRPPEPEVEMARNFRLQPREEPEPVSREYEAWDPGWTLVRTSNDPVYTNPQRVL